MSSIDDAFRQSRVLFGLKQKPNWEGMVYGACQNEGCSQYRKIGYYLRGFCKVCSSRHRDDHNLAVMSTVQRPSRRQDILNPRLRWIKKMWVKDLSHLMTVAQRKEFYDKPADGRRDKPDKEVEDMFSLRG